LLGAEFFLNLVQPLPPSWLAISIHAQNEDVHHCLVLLNNFSDTLRFQRFLNTAQQGIIANFHSRRTFPNRFEKPLKQRLQQVLVLAEVFRNHEDIHASFP